MLGFIFQVFSKCKKKSNFAEVSKIDFYKITILVLFYKYKRFFDIYYIY